MTKELGKEIRDLPKGYQLSQRHKPLAINGGVDIVGEDDRIKRLRITPHPHGRRRG